MDINRVKEHLAAISSLEDEEIEKYGVLIENAISWVSSRTQETDNDKCALLSAAKANYDISLAQSSTEEVTSFKAGDVSLTSAKGNTLQSAKLLFESLLNDCSDIINDRAFDFRCV